MDNTRLTFLTTASCNGGCNHCSVTPWMKANKGYKMDIVDIIRFCEFSESSDYHFKEINFAGGEPLLWDEIITGAKLLKHYGIVDSIAVITNGLEIKPERKEFINALVEVVDHIRISEYRGNEENILYARENFPKIQVSCQTKRPCTPDGLIEGTLPADCICRGRGFFNGQVTVCSPYKTMGVSVPHLETPVKEGFLSHFDNIERTNQPYCQLCVANKKIHPFIKWCENEV